MLLLRDTGFDTAHFEGAMRFNELSSEHAFYREFLEE